MKPSNARSVKWLLLSAAACVLCAAASCSQDGVTPTCPPLPRYQTFDLGDASVPNAMSGDSAASKEELAAAVAAGCATGPSGTQVAAGGGASGGSGGKAGTAGKGGAGNGGADNAGAAGSR